MIQVLTLSPAIDVTYRVSNVRIGSQHRILEVHRRPGGKGGNVARIAAALGMSVDLIAPLAGQAGDWYRKAMAESAISGRFVDGAETTRQCVTVTDMTTATEFNEPAPAISDEVLSEIVDNLHQSSLTVICGSFPPAAARKQLFAIFERAREVSDTLIVDTSGEAQAISAEFADFITPNRRELAELAGSEDFADAFTSLRRAHPVVTLGEHGVVFEPGSPRVFAAPRQDGNPTGAGDAFVAGFASALNGGLDRAVAFGVAVSAASVREPVAGDVSLNVVNELLTQVQEEIYAPRAY